MTLSYEFSANARELERGPIVRQMNGKASEPGPMFTSIRLESLSSDCDYERLPFKSKVEVPLGKRYHLRARRWRYNA